MTDQTAATTQLFVVERYDDTGGPGAVQPIPAAPADVRVIYTVRVPADDVVLALVEGRDEHSIRASLGDVGWRIDRITGATWACPDQEGPQ